MVRVLLLMNNRAQFQDNKECLSFFNENNKLRTAECLVSQLYGFDSTNVIDKPIDFKKVSTKTANVLRRNNIFTLYRLLALKNTDLMSFQGFGRRCFEDLDSYLLHLDKKGNYKLTDKSSSVYNYLLHKNVILSGERELISQDVLTGIPDRKIELLMERYELVDSDLIRQCGCNTEYAKTIISSLETFIEKTTQNKKINSILNILPTYKKNNYILSIITMVGSHIEIS